MAFLEGLRMTIAKKLGIKPGMKLTKEMEKKAQELVLEEYNRVSKN